MARGWLAVIAIALLLGPASAEAATVSLQHGLLRFEAAPGEQNYVSVAPSPEHNGWLRVSAIPQPAPGPGCERHRFGDPPASPVELIECRLVDGARGTRASISLGDRSDSADIEGPLAGATITGGSGRDGLSALRMRTAPVRLYGDGGDDGLSAYTSPGTVARGGPGDDRLSGSGRLYGGSGDDTFNSYRARSVMVLGPGEDRVTSTAEKERDIVRARDGGFDTIACGPGKKLDRLFLDALDWTSDCKAGQIARSGTPRALPLRFSADPRLRQGPGLFVTVGCPVDVDRRCRGAVAASVAGRSPRSRRFRVASGESRIVRVGRTPYCAVRRLDAAGFTVRTAPEGLLASRSLALSRHDPPRPVDRLRLPDGKRLLLTLEPAPDSETTMAVVRRRSGCKLDPSFGANGVLGLLWRATAIPPQANGTSSQPGWGGFVRLVRLASGRIVLGGTHLDYSVHFLCCPSSIGLAAIMPDGAVDRAFGDGGFAEARFPEQADPGVIVGADAFRAEQDAGGGTTLVLAGLLSGPERSGRVFARFTETGELVEEHFTPRP